MTSHGDRGKPTGWFLGIFDIKEKDKTINRDMNSVLQGECIISKSKTISVDTEIYYEEKGDMIQNKMLNIYLEVGGVVGK